MPISTREFTIKQNSLLTQLLLMRLRQRPLFKCILICISLLWVGTIVIGCVIDIRCIIVSLMILFIITPLIMAIIYINDTLSIGVFFNTIPHTITADHTGCTISYYIIDHNDDFEAAHDKRTKRTLKELHFKNQDLKPYYITTTGVVIPVETHTDKGLIIIPSSTFDNVGQLNQFLDVIYDNSK